MSTGSRSPAPVRPPNPYCDVSDTSAVRDVILVPCGNPTSVRNNPQPTSSLERRCKYTVLRSLQRTSAVPTHSQRRCAQATRYTAYDMRRKSSKSSSRVSLPRRAHVRDAARSGSILDRPPSFLVLSGSRTGYLWIVGRRPMHPAAGVSIWLRNPGTYLLTAGFPLGIGARVPGVG